MYVCCAEVGAYFSLADSAFNSLQVHEKKSLFLDKIRRIELNLLEWGMLLREENMPYLPFAFRSPFPIHFGMLQIYDHLLAFPTLQLAAVLNLDIDPVHQSKI